MIHLQIPCIMYVSNGVAEHTYLDVTESKKTVLSKLGQHGLFLLVYKKGELGFDNLAHAKFA